MHSSNSPQFFLVFWANHTKSCVFLSLSASDMVSGKVKHRFRKPLFYPLNYGGHENCSTNQRPIVELKSEIPLTPLRELESFNLLSRKLRSEILKADRP